MQPSGNGNGSSKSGRDYVIESDLYQVLKPKEDSKSHHILDKISGTTKQLRIIKLEKKI